MKRISLNYHETTCHKTSLLTCHITSCHKTSSITPYKTIFFYLPRNELPRKELFFRATKRFATKRWKLVVNFGFRMHYILYIGSVFLRITSLPGLTKSRVFMVLKFFFTAVNTRYFLRGKIFHVKFERKFPLLQ